MKPHGLAAQLEGEWTRAKATGNRRMEPAVQAAALPSLCKRVERKQRKALFRPSAPAVADLEVAVRDTELLRDDLGASDGDERGLAERREDNPGELAIGRRASAEGARAVIARRIIPFQCPSTEIELQYHSRRVCPPYGCLRVLLPQIVAFQHESFR
jgi:hypothetical protein